MRFYILISCIVMLSIALFGCAGSPTPLPTLPRAFKGYELYSWQEGNMWHFSLVPGTNRLKTVQEIKSSPNAVQGAEAAKGQLGRLSPGEQVFWAGSGTDFALPAEDLVRQIQQFCADAGIELTVAGRGG